MRVNLPRMRVKEMEFIEFLPRMRVTAPLMRVKNSLFHTFITPYEYTYIDINHTVANQLTITTGIP